MKWRFIGSRNWQTFLLWQSKTVVQTKRRTFHHVLRKKTGERPGDEVPLANACKVACSDSEGEQKVACRAGVFYERSLKIALGRHFGSN